MPGRSPAEWARIIQYHMGHVAKANSDLITWYLKAGCELAQAKQQLGLTGEPWRSWVEGKCGVSQPTASRLMAAATCPAYQDRSRRNRLPPHLKTLAKLTQMDESSLAAAIDAGVVTPDMTLTEAAKLVVQATKVRTRTEAQEKTIAAKARQVGKLLTDPGVRQAVVEDEEVREIFREVAADEVAADSDDGLLDGTDDEIARVVMERLGAGRAARIAAAITGLLHEAACVR